MSTDAAADVPFYPSLVIAGGSFLSSFFLSLPFATPDASHMQATLVLPSRRTVDPITSSYNRMFHAHTRTKERTECKAYNRVANVSKLQLATRNSQLATCTLSLCSLFIQAYFSTRLLYPSFLVRHPHLSFPLPFLFFHSSFLSLRLKWEEVLFVWCMRNFTPRSPSSELSKGLSVQCTMRKRERMCASVWLDRPAAG